MPRACGSVRSGGWGATRLEPLGFSQALQGQDNRAPEKPEALRIPNNICMISMEHLTRQKTHVVNYAKIKHVQAQEIPLHVVSRMEGKAVVGGKEAARGGTLF